MFEDQLLLAVVFQQYRIFIERPDLACELDSADEVDGDRTLIFSHGVKKSILNVLCRLLFHGADLLC